MTDEQLRLYLDRGGERHERRFSREVQAMRAGYVFAHDHKAFQRWLVATRQPSAAVTGPGGRPLTGADLEHVLGAMLITNPDIVAVVPLGPDGYPQRRRPN